MKIGDTCWVIYGGEIHKGRLISSKGNRACYLHEGAVFFTTFSDMFDREADARDERDYRAGRPI